MKAAESERKRKRRKAHMELGAAWRPTLTLAALCWAALSLAARQPAEASQAPVVRPTIFSDLNQPPQEGALQQQQQQQHQAQVALQQQQQTQQQQQAQQQQQQQPQASTHQISQANSALPDSSAQSTRITPLKSRFCASPNGARLDAPLGLQSLAIDDLAISASSYSNEQVAPPLARLNLDIAGGAWCPVKPISGSNFGKEWIQVKLNRSYVISAIETQGRFGMGNGKEFVPSYQVEYSRDAGRSWHKWKDFRGSSLLRANEDPSSAVRNELSPPVVGANVIRILPYSLHLRTVCLRLELHGCPYDEGAPIAYASQDGVVEPRFGHLVDYTYDGARTRAGLLSGGLGQLVDGVKGPDNFSVNNGFEWVGWRSATGDLVLEFAFKTVRNFTGALFHSNNLFSSGVEVFQAVDVHFGVDAALSMDAIKDSLNEQRRRDALLRRPAQPASANFKTTSTQLQDAAHANLEALGANQDGWGATLWSADVLSIEYEPDKKLEAARPVTVHLKQRLANKLRFVLKFASRWILLSEVEFLSQPVELLASQVEWPQHTVALLQALAPAKSYDEYVAILREHQLRRIANSFLQILDDQPAVNYSSGPLDELAPASSSAEPPSQQLAASFSPQLDSPLRQASRPWLAPLDAGAPATNPMLSQPPNQILFNPLNNQLDTTPTIDFAPAPMQKAGQSATADADSLGNRQTLGVATLVSLVLVAVLLFLGALFALSSYRLRHQPKLSAPLATGGNHFGAGRKNKLASLTSVFSWALGGGRRGQQPPQANHYNAIFANHHQAAPQASAADAMRAASTLRRLATLTGAQKSAHPLLAQQQQQPPGQLLVSVKEPLFGSSTQAGRHKSQAVSSQLILGLNQANPFAQQQIYNNAATFSSCQQQAPAYATHYSTSMSMASSSTTGHQGDYADYAIPDAQPIIPGLQAHSAAHQQHLNHGFASNAHRAQPFGYQTTDARSTNLIGANQRHLSALIQPQQQQVNGQHLMRPNQEHNYELIYQDSSRPQATGGQHQRTLSNQALISCQPASFNSMTLSHAANSRHFHQQLEQPRKSSFVAPGAKLEESSPGGSSQQSAATTTTSASSANAARDNDNNKQQAAGHYYYSAAAANPNTLNAFENRA